jgi:hypothetical protein
LLFLAFMFFQGLMGRKKRKKTFWNGLKSHIGTRVPAWELGPILIKAHIPLARTTISLQGHHKVLIVIGPTSPAHLVRLSVK